MDRRHYYDPPTDYESAPDYRSRGTAGAPGNRKVEYGEDLSLLDTLDENTVLNVVKSRFLRHIIHVSLW